MATTPTARGRRAVEDILTAGRDVLLESGPDRLSLREVARRADYTPSALYNHFADREQLIVALAMQSVETLAGYLDAVPAGPARSRLRGLAAAYLRFASENPEEYRVVFDCLVNPPNTWAEYAQVARPFATIVAACAQGLREGVLTDPAGVGASGLAYGLWALLDGHVHLRAKHLAAVNGPFDDMVRATLDTLIGVDAPEEMGR
jgi:AcrR family transcriptional regulator